MREELLASAEDAVRLAKEAGADEVFASTSRTREVEFTVRDATLEKVKDATSKSLSLRLYVDDRFSRHSTTDLRPEQVKAFVAEAIALTRALEPDPHRKITDPALYEGRAEVDLELVDAGIPALTREERLALCEAQNALLAGKDKVVSATSGCSDGTTVSAAASSNGFRGIHEETWLWIGSEVTLRDEGDKRPEAWMWAGAANRADVPAPEEVARIALERAHQRLGSTKGPTSRTTMVVDPSAAPRLVSRLLAPADGGQVQQGQSFYAGRKGQKVVSELLTVVDDPLVPRGLGSRLYDGEGIAAKRLPIIEAGVLQNLYVDTYYGRKLGWAPTTGSPSNRLLGLGDQGLEALLAAADGGVYVTSWLGGNADSTTGDFSFGIRGHLIEGGQIGSPVGEMNITGNLVDLFSKLVALGNDPWPYSSIRAPTLVFEDVQFSGT
ncbi:MAG: TldD/PmbA family protein [Deltaproteobacteria bacterium]|nr:TldD/PmbA family protein [Deltaproteobacteria bacterium]